MEKNSITQKKPDLPTTLCWNWERWSNQNICRSCLRHAQITNTPLSQTSKIYGEVASMSSYECQAWVQLQSKQFVHSLPSYSTSLSGWLLINGYPDKMGRLSFDNQDIHIYPSSQGNGSFHPSQIRRDTEMEMSAAAKRSNSICTQLFLSFTLCNAHKVRHHNRDFKRELWRGPKMMPGLQMHTQLQGEVEETELAIIN